MDKGGRATTYVDCEVCNREVALRGCNTTIRSKYESYVCWDCSPAWFYARRATLTCADCERKMSKSERHRTHYHSTGEDLCYPCYEKRYSETCAVRRAAAMKAHETKRQKTAHIVEPEEVYWDRFNRRIEVWRVDKWRKHLEQVG